MSYDEQEMFDFIVDLIRKNGQGYINPFDFEIAELLYKDRTQRQKVQGILSSLEKKGYIIIIGTGQNRRIIA